MVVDNYPTKVKPTNWVYGTTEFNILQAVFSKTYFRFLSSYAIIPNSTFPEVKIMTSFEIRKKFFDYFIQHKHTQVPSSSLIPAQDPTLLFANAGMNQFKDVFLGKEQRSYKRAVSIQKCIRAGGKHNDLENVGFTKRHLTFFEMMGNFSFGDYFKKDAIEFAWEFLTNVIKLDKNKLYASVYRLDNEAYDIWHTSIGLPENRIVRLGEADNFWQMGDTGPCGPCSEIYIDRGEMEECGSKDCAPGCSCDRFLEIWNLVFMQYDRQPDGTDVPLKQTGVDTGMGLERLCAIVQGKDSVFDTDLFASLIKRIESLTGIFYETAKPEIQAAFRVLSDHIRSSSFAIADGGTPSNEGRGYVIRKIIRRAALFAQRLKKENIFPDLAPALIEYMSPLYPELKTQEKQIISLLRSEVEKFEKNFIHGQQILEKYFIEAAATKIISGAYAFKLYDTYGFPLELTKVIAQERGYTIDVGGFEQHMEAQRAQSGKKQTHEEIAIDESIETVFTGYDEHINKATITGLIVDTRPVQEIAAGTEAYIITDRSPFFVECGGQVSDQGTIKIGTHDVPLRGLKKMGNAIGAFINAPQPMKIGDSVTLIVDSPSRINTMKNHTATHLLQAALIDVLGKQVRQSGSVVTPDYLRFDFTYHENLTPEQITLVENIVNNKILENIPVIVESATLKEASNRGVIAIFGEKYNPEKVRIVEVPGFSAELCGGTHVHATGDIGLLKITEVTGLSAGNRRIVALTGPAAIELFQQNFNALKTLGQEFKVPSDQVVDAVRKLKEQLKATRLHAQELKKQLYLLQMPQWITRLENYGHIPFLFLTLKDASNDDLREIAQEFLKAQRGLYFLVAQGERTMYLASLAPSLAQYVDLKAFAQWLKEQGLQGGGSGTTLQGGAPKIDLEFEYAIKKWLHEHAQ